MPVSLKPFNGLLQRHGPVEAFQQGVFVFRQLKKLARNRVFQDNPGLAAIFLLVAGYEIDTEFGPASIQTRFRSARISLVQTIR